MNNVNIIIGQSGGPTPVINMSLRGIVETAINHNSIGTVYGSYNGLEGLLKKKVINLSNKLDLIHRASYQPGSILGASRHPLQEHELDMILNHMKELDITYFFYIGGNGSSRTVWALDQYARSTGRDMRFIHIPKTVDNDICGTDHTPGFASAAKLVSHLTQWAAADLRSMNTFDKIKIIEVMGRNAGWLAGSTAIGKKTEGAAPHLVYLPEHFVTLDGIINDVDQAVKKYENIVMVVPDHLRISETEFVNDHDSSSSELSCAGHPGGVSNYLARMIHHHLGIKARYDAPGTLIRSAQGFLSKLDQKEAFDLGASSVNYIHEGRSGGMVCLERVSNHPYESRIIWRSLDGISGIERTFPEHYWCRDTNMPTDSFREYLTPLIDNDIPSIVSSLD